MSFVTYIVAEHLHVSGVLATVTAGRRPGPLRAADPVVRRRGSRAPRSGRRVIFLLNALVFVLIGLQLPVVLKTLDWPWPVVVDGIFATFGDDGRRPPRVDVPGRLPAAVPVPEIPQDATRIRRGRPSSSWAGPGCAASCRSRPRCRSRSSSRTGGRSRRAASSSSSRSP